MLGKALVVLAVVLATASALSAGAERRHRIAAASLNAADETETEQEQVEKVDVPDKMPVDVYQVLEKRGLWLITKLVIHRAPIQAFIPSVLNFLSGGKWRDALESAGGYDKMFHLSIVATVTSPDGKETEYYKIEKSPNVEVTKLKAAIDVHSADSVKEKLEEHPFQVQPNTKLSDLFREAATTKGFWLYDAFNRPPYAENGGNCQDFVRRILTTISPNNRLPEDVVNWVFQDGVTIGEHLGWFSRAVAKTLTNTGAIVDIAKDTIAHPMVAARQMRAGSFVEADADADAQDEDEEEVDVADEAEAEDEEEAEAEEEADDEVEADF